MKSAGKARNNGLYRHIRTSKEIIRNLLNDLHNYFHLGEGDGKNLCTEFSTQMPVFTTDELCTLRCSGDCLFGN